MDGGDFSSTPYSPDEVRNWSFGEVLFSKTINRRTLRPDKDGLFCEQIFGPTRDYHCSCGKYRTIFYQGIVCDECGVQVAPARVRGERMGHIELAAPAAHPRFARGNPSPMALVLGIPQHSLEAVLSFSQYIVISVDEYRRRQVKKMLEEEAHQKRASGAEEPELHLKDIEDIRPLATFTEDRYRELEQRYNFFRAGMGAEALLAILEKMDLETVRGKVVQEAGSTPSGQRAEDTASPLPVIDALRRSGARPEWMVLTVLPVLPPDLRPIVQLAGGRFASHDLNNLYRRLIDRNNRLKRFYELGAPELITRNAKRLVQEAVDTLLCHLLQAPERKRADTEEGSVMKADEEPLLEDTAPEVFSSLPPVQQRVLTLRFGLEDGHSRTVEEVGKEFGVSPDRIRQTEDEAWSRLRYFSRCRMFKGGWRWCWGAAVLRTLPRKDQAVLSLRFGLEDGRSRPLDEVARQLGVCPERIRLVESRALRKLRHPARLLRVKDFIGAKDEAYGEFLDWLYRGLQDEEPPKTSVDDVPPAGSSPAPCIEPPAPLKETHWFFDTGEQCSESVDRTGLQPDFDQVMKDAIARVRRAGSEEASKGQD